MCGGVSDSEGNNGSDNGCAKGSGNGRDRDSGRCFVVHHSGFDNLNLCIKFRDSHTFTFMYISSRPVYTSQL